MDDNPDEKEMPLNRIGVDRFGKKFLIEDKLPKEEWVILDSTRIVAGWSCKLAVKKNNSWEKAWFTMDFPLACEPLGECGLPGLIVSYEFDNGILTLESIEKVDREVVPAPKGGKRMTIDEYTKFSRKANQDFFDEQQRIAEEFAKKNKQ